MFEDEELYWDANDDDSGYSEWLEDWCAAAEEEENYYFNDWCAVTD